MKREEIKTENTTNPEEVEATLDSIRAEQESKKNERHGFGKFLYALGTPFRWLGKCFRAVGRKMRLPLGVKTTIIYTSLSALATVGLILYIILSVWHRLETAGAGGVDAEFVASLVIGSVIIAVIAVAVVAGLGMVAGHVMLAPMRKMIRQIDAIDASDLSKRLDDVDSQDELRELTERINNLLSDIEDSFNRQKKFVSDASHELKTPIAVIRGYSDMLTRWGKDDKAVLDESVEAIKREAENMQRIVEQLLFLAKLGKFSLNPTVFDLAAELRALIDAYSVAGVTNPITYAGLEKCVVNLDKNMISECVRALTDNAVKYSDPSAPIEIRLNRTENGLLIDVADNGQGIAEKDLPYVFDRFYRCDRARARDGNSTGLGLTITKSIVETMHGKVSVVSTMGKGSTFTVFIPTEGNYE